jgi:hypothetical protein
MLKIFGSETEKWKLSFKFGEKYKSARNGEIVSEKSITKESAWGEGGLPL